MAKLDIHVDLPPHTHPADQIIVHNGDFPNGDGDGVLAKRLAALLDCSPDDVVESIEAQLRFMDHTTAVQSDLEFEAIRLESDREQLQSVRRAARDSLLLIDRDEMSTEETAIILLQALSDIASGK